MSDASTDLSHASPPLPVGDDMVAPFQIEGEAVRGRIARLGAVVDDILSRHAYPEPVANLLGEACVLAALVGASLKFQGRLIVQAQGDGPVRYVVADFDTSGALRGYCRFDADAVAAASTGFARAGARSLLGQGLFVMTLDPADMKERHQGVVAIEGETLALCAEQYFAQSEQVPTRVRLAVAQGPDGRWRAGGAVIQNVADDDARGSTADAWERAQALFETLGEDELVEADLPAERLLYRLFHEDGVRVFPAKALSAECRCSPERVAGMLQAFPQAERAEMVEADGRIHVTCEYCARAYAIAPDLEGAPAEARAAAG